MCRLIAGVGEDVVVCKYRIFSNLNWQTPRNNYLVMYRNGRFLKGYDLASHDVDELEKYEVYIVYRHKNVPEHRHTGTSQKNSC